MSDRRSTTALKASGSTRRRAWLCAATLALALAGGVSGFVDASDGLSAVRRAGAARALSAAAAASLPEAELTARFSRHALNALLAPLLDDAEPPRWTDVALRFFCGPATQVEINGQPMLPGAPIPAVPFKVRWTIDRCWPLDYATYELSGVVELLVSHEADGLSALVDAQRLRVATARGSGTPGTPFPAWMALRTGAAPP